MSRLIIVSNRVSGNRPDRHTAGGLSTGLSSWLKKKGGIWFGWSGNVGNDNTDLHIKTDTASGITYATIDLDEEEYKGYYHGFANSTLWPCFHFRTDHLRFDPKAYETYRHVNEKWAQLLKDKLRPDDLIWVHDYHLIPFARCCREIGIQNKIGFFLHIPFPPAEIFAHIPCGDELLLDLCHYELVGFHTESYRQSFQRSLSLLSHCHHPSTGLPAGVSYSVETGVFPMGIDILEIQNHAVSTEKQLQPRHHTHPIVISVDRLDYSKGLLERLNGYEHFLERYASLARKFSYLQIIPDCRLENPVYQSLRKNLQLRIKHINDRFSILRPHPVRYINKTLPREDVAYLLREASAGLITPMCDGMNLLAKEFVAAQNPLDPGVLILSRFAGAAKELNAALLINPMDKTAVASALKKALTMPIKERRQRHGELMKSLQQNPVERWAHDFLHKLRYPAKRTELRQPAPFHDIQPLRIQRPTVQGVSYAQRYNA